MSIERPIIKDYVGLREAIREEKRKQLQIKMNKKYLNRSVVVDIELNVWVSKKLLSEVNT